MDWIDGLRAIKARTNLSTREIAEKSGLPEPTLEKLFSGQTKNPGINTVKQLVHALGYTLDDLDGVHVKPTLHLDHAKCKRHLYAAILAGIQQDYVQLVR